MSTYEQIAKALACEIDTIKSKLGNFECNNWSAAFVEECERLHAEYQTDWGPNWSVECNGKELLMRVCNHYGAQKPRLEIKKDIMRKIREAQTNEWKSMKTIIDGIMA